MFRKLSAQEINNLTKAGMDPFEIDMKKLGDKPVEHISETAEFYNRQFRVNNNVLIPRIETERLIEIALQKLKTPRKHKNIIFADIGTGSGIIGLTFALELQKINIEFNGYLSDVSLEALEVAVQNLKRHFPNTKEIGSTSTFEIGKSKLKVLKSDLIKDYPEALRFDFIFANLPYIPSSRIETLDKSVKDFEPHLALDGGEDGTNLISELLVEAYTPLKKNGILLLEVDDSHTSEVWESPKFKEDRDFWHNEILSDLTERNRYWILTKKQ